MENSVGNSASKCEIAPRVRLQARDREILFFLRTQGYATLEQLSRKFFTGIDPCKQRLSLLIRNNLVDAVTSSDVLANSRHSIEVAQLNLHQRTKLYRVSESFLRDWPGTRKLLKPNMVFHQLLLNEVRMTYEELIGTEFVLSDPEVSALTELNFDRDSELVPDLSFEEGPLRIAVELERTQKSLLRYNQRFWRYRNSNYACVIYVYLKEGHLRSLLKFAGAYRKFAFARYDQPGEVVTKTWGRMELTEFIDKMRSIELATEGGRNV